MNYSISSANVRIFAFVIGTLGIISIIANVHPLLTTAFVVVYCFAVPALQIQDYLQAKFVGLEIRGKTIFFFPIILPLLILVSIPFWALNNEYPQMTFPWTAIILVVTILIETVFVMKSARSLNFQIASENLRNLFLGLIGLIFGLFLAWLF